MDASSLRTERLVILPLSSSDIDEVAALYADPEVMRHVANGVLTRSQTSEYLSASEHSREQNRWGLWAIRDATTGGLLGESGIRPFTEIADAAIEFGITLGRRNWRAGIATEASEVILDDVWTIFPGSRIHASVQPDNTAGHAVLRKLNFKSAGKQSLHGQPHQIWVLSRPE